MLEYVWHKGFTKITADKVENRKLYERGVRQGAIEVQ